MRPRYIFLIISIALCVFSITIIMIKGKSQDKVSFDSVSEIGEGVLYSMDKVGRMVTSVSDQEEMEIGDKIHDKILESWLVLRIQNTPIDKYINEVGGKVAKNVKRKDIKYKFHIIEGSYPTAFAISGGHVYITIGLLLALKSEAELAAVLAHEITHIDAKHCIGVIQYKIKTEKMSGANIGTFVDIGYDKFLEPGFSEVQEIEADVGGVYLSYQAGYHLMGLAYAFERIDKELLSKKYTDTSITPVGDTLKAVNEMVWRYFATHPSALDRIDKIKKYITDNELINENSRFYIGQRNYKEKISCDIKRYKEEFKKDYVIIEEKTEAETVTEEQKERLLDEVYTHYGRIASGMAVAEVEKILPVTLRAFKYETRMGYKNITIYDFDKNSISSVGLWVELKNDKVKGMRLIE